MKRKVIGVALLASAIAGSITAVTPSEASAFEMTPPPIEGKYNGDLLSLDVKYSQGDSAGLQANQAKISVFLNKLGDNASKDLRIRSFGLNFDRRFSEYISFGSVSGYKVRGNGTQSQRLAGASKDAKFDYVVTSKTNSSARTSFDVIVSLSENNPAMLDRFLKTTFTKGATTTFGRSRYSGQAGSTVLELDEHFAKIGKANLAGEVPTPAMLPGLIGLGVAAFRKRKASSGEDVQGGIALED